MALDSNQWMAKVRQDSHAAAIQVIEVFYERIYAFLRRLAGNETDAADLTQRTFSRVQQSLPSFAGRSSVSSMLANAPEAFLQSPISLPGLRMINPQLMPDGSLQAELEIIPGTLMPTPVVLRQINGEWKLDSGL